MRRMSGFGSDLAHLDDACRRGAAGRRHQNDPAAARRRGAGARTDARRPSRGRAWRPQRAGPALQAAARPARLASRATRPRSGFARGRPPSTEDRKLRDSGVKGGPPGTPFNLENKQVLLKDLPKEEVRAYLAHFALPLRLADDAARRDHCDWEMPPLTIQEMDFPLDEIQHLRTIAGSADQPLPAGTERAAASTTRSAPCRPASRWPATSIRPTR